VKVPVPVYGAVPPVADTVTLVVPPLHAIGAKVAVATKAAGALTVPVVTEVQPLASVTV